MKESSNLGNTQDFVRYSQNTLLVNVHLLIAYLLLAQIVLLLRMVPLLPFNMLNYLLAVTPISCYEYTLASWLGLMVSDYWPLVVSGFSFPPILSVEKEIYGASRSFSRARNSSWICFA
jgi:hypothetical protein